MSLGLPPARPIFYMATVDVRFSTREYGEKKTMDILLSTRREDDAACLIEARTGLKTEV